jgi:hypothetical protein
VERSLSQRSDKTCSGLRCGMEIFDSACLSISLTLPALNATWYPSYGSDGYLCEALDKGPHWDYHGWNTDSNETCQDLHAPTSAAT